MRKHEISLAELVLIGATRGMVGAGIGLLAANQVSKDHRRIVGTVLLAVGALSTIPLALRVFRRKQSDLRADDHRARTSSASTMTH